MLLIFFEFQGLIFGLNNTEVALQCQEIIFTKGKKFSLMEAAACIEAGQG
jgi:hypothetical protein